MWAIGQNGHGGPGRMPALRRAAPGLDRTPRSAFAAVMFADIVGFTRLCETLEPAGTFALLSGFHQRMAEAVVEHGAAIGDPIGDGIMAVWCGPAPAVARSALRCGFAMLEAIEDWNRARRDGLPLRIGIGLHAGTVMIGRVGAAGHDKLGAFGDTVNVAHRLERMTRAHHSDIIVSEELFRAVALHHPAERRLAWFPAGGRADIPGRAEGMAIRAAVLA
ncbi:adenylate/guanylate cyclase domain-containing protein [Inquilinus sp. OTU3971]|uniref:adenylate/guanylate cyclase domain-containing protein n=1 Tax=Inquilinus sp. OTU3971 TaxID=3043855 RepID=UPI00313E8902